MNPRPLLCIPMSAESHLRLMEMRYVTAYEIVIARNREHLCQWQSWADENSLLPFSSIVRSQLQGFINGQMVPMGIWYQDKPVGAITLLIQFNHYGTLNYWLDAAMQGKGLMTLAARTLISYAFNEYDLGKMEIHCAVENNRSRAVAERLSFQQEGIMRQRERLKDRCIDHVVYGILASEWRY